MHGEHRNAYVHYVHVQVGHILGNSSAAAQIHAAQLAGLPQDVVVVQQVPNLAHELGGSIRGAALAAGAGVLDNAYALVQIAGVVGLISGSIGGVISGGHVSGEAGGLGQHIVAVHPVLLGQGVDKVPQIGGLQASVAGAAGLFLVGENGDDRLLGNLAAVEDGFQGGIGADPVIVAIGAYHAPVQADVHSLKGGHKLNLSGDEVLLHHAVFLVEEPQNVQLEQVLALFGADRTAAEEDVQILALDGLAQGLDRLLLCQVGQQVGDAELGIAGLLTDADLHLFTAAEHHAAVHGQRDSSPLVLLDAAVIVGLQQGQVAGLIQRDRLQIDAGAVDMSGGNAHALPASLFTDNGQHHGLAAVVHIHLVPGLVRSGGVIGHKALSFCPADGLFSGLPLGFAGVHKDLIVLAELVSPGNFFIIHLEEAVFLVQGQLFGESFHIHGFGFHFPLPPVKIKSMVD